MDIFNTCYKMSALSMEGMQQKYDVITDILKKEKRAAN
jgi:hypothetical protein